MSDKQNLYRLRGWQKVIDKDVAKGINRDSIQRQITTEAMELHRKNWNLMAKSDFKLFKIIIPKK